MLNLTKIAAGLTVLLASFALATPVIAYAKSSCPCASSACKKHTQASGCKKHCKQKDCAKHCPGK